MGVSLARYVRIDKAQVCIAHEPARTEQSSQAADLLATGLAWLVNVELSWLLDIGF